MKDNELIVVDIHLYFQTPRVWQSICGRVNPWQWPDKHKQAGTDLPCWNITPANIPKYSCSHIQIHIVHRVAEKCFNKTIFKLIYFLYISLMVMTPHHLYIYIMVSSYGTADVFFSFFFDELAAQHSNTWLVLAVAVGAPPSSPAPPVHICYRVIHVCYMRVIPYMLYVQFQYFFHAHSSILWMYWK